MLLRLGTWLSLRWIALQKIYDARVKRKALFAQYRNDKDARNAHDAAIRAEEEAIIAQRTATESATSSASFVQNMNVYQRESQYRILQQQANQHRLQAMSQHQYQQQQHQQHSRYMQQLAAATRRQANNAHVSPPIIYHQQNPQIHQHHQLDHQAEHQLSSPYDISNSNAAASHQSAPARQYTQEEIVQQQVLAQYEIQQQYQQAQQHAQAIHQYQQQLAMRQQQVEHQRFLHSQRMQQQQQLQQQVLQQQQHLQQQAPRQSTSIVQQSGVALPNAAEILPRLRLSLDPQIDVSTVSTRFLEHVTLDYAQQLIAQNGQLLLAVTAQFDAGDMTQHPRILKHFQNHVARAIELQRIEQEKLRLKAQAAQQESMTISNPNSNQSSNPSSARTSVECASTAAVQSPSPPREEIVTQSGNASVPATAPIAAQTNVITLDADNDMPMLEKGDD
jgi:hypothetical protein